MPQLKFLLYLLTSNAIADHHPQLQKLSQVGRKCKTFIQMGGKTCSYVIKTLKFDRLTGRLIIKGCQLFFFVIQ